MELKRIGILSSGKIQGAVGALIGLLIGALFTLISLIGAAAGYASGDENALFGALFGIGAIAILPIFYGVLSFLAGLLWAALYNLVARLVGGLELELQ